MTVRIKALRAISPLLLIPGFAGPAFAQVAPALKPAAAPADVIQLNPFVIIDRPDDGYAPTETLAGTRVKTQAKDLASALSMISPDMLADLGAMSFDDVVDFLPSTSAFLLDDTNTARNGTPFNVRGFVSNSLTANFFPTIVPIDTYNTSRLTFARGPNSILFGVGNPGGGLDTSTNGPSLEKNSGSLGVRFDSYDSYRFTVDSSTVIIPDKLGLRVDLLKEDRRRYFTPAKNRRDSAYAAVAYRPFPQTTVIANGEVARIHQDLSRGNVVIDQVTPWLLAGSPTKAAYGNTAVTNGLNFTPNNGYIAVVEGQPAIAPMDWSSSALGAIYRVNGANNARTSFSNPAIVPLKTNVAGESSPVKKNSTSASLFLQQSIGRKLSFEVAGAYEHLFLYNLDALTFAANSIKVDANERLPNGATNPNVRMPFVETASQFYIESPSDIAQARAAVLYETDLGPARLFGRKLGVLRLGGMGSYYHLHQLFVNQQEVNLTPLRTTGTLGRLDNAVNIIHRRYYLRPGGNNYLTTDWAPVNAGGIRSGWAQVRLAPRDSITTTSAYVGTAQFDLLENLAVGTFGYRRERVMLDQAVYTRDSRGVFPEIENPSGTLSRTSRGETYSAGMVIHPTRHFSLFANRATNFVPPGSAVNLSIDGIPAEPTEGVGYDAGIKLNFLDGRITASLGNFATEQQNVLDSLNGSKAGAIAAIWNSVDLNRAPPATWTGFKNTKTVGYELQLVGNPTRNLRLMVTGSKNLTTTASRGADVFAYVDRHLPEWRQKASTPVISNLGDTVGDMVKIVTDEVANDKTQIGLRQTRNSEWQLSGVGRYKFDETSRLKGFAIGSAFTWRDAPAIGFAVLPGTQLFDIRRPFFGSDYLNVDGWIEYSRFLRNRRVRWETQLRAENLTNPRTAAPTSAVDDGSGGRWTEIRSLPRGLGVSLTSKFSF